MSEKLTTAVIGVEGIAVIATEDRAFDQAMLQHMATRAGARITNVSASHALYLTPDQRVRVW